MNKAEFLLADVLASGVHDVKNSLFAAEAHLLPGDINARAACTLIRSASIRLNKMLGAYHLLRHDLQLPITVITISELIEDAVLQAKESFERKIKVVVKLQTNGDWMLAREEINDVLINALQNADRFAKSLIEVRAYQSEQDLFLEIHDDGPGFPEGLKIGKPDGKGRGLGLFIATRVASHHKRKHGDQIVEGSVLLSKSEHLGGGKFTLRLP